MTKSTEIVVIEEQDEAVPPKQEPTRNNLFSLFPIPKLNLQLPFLNLNPTKPNPKDKAVVVGDNGDQGGNQNQNQSQEQEGPKPTVVWFPKTQVVVPPPLEAEAEVQDSTTKTSNPIILWQVYALGAIFISRWIWARWNERKAQGKSPNDERAEGSHSDDGRRSSDNE